LKHSRLLVLSVGTRVGQNVLTTLAGRRDVLDVIATSSVANEPAIFDYDVVYLVPQTVAEPAAFESRLLDIMAREAIDLVIPCRDDDVLFLAALRDRRPDLAPRLLCGSAAAARLIVDKWASAEFCAAHGLPFVPSIMQSPPSVHAAFAQRHGFPLVAKPRRGYASLDVYIITNEAQLERALARDDCIVQKFLGDPQVVARYLANVERDGLPLFHTFQGLKHSLQALIAPDGAIAHVICTRNQSDRRRSKTVAPDPDPASHDIGARCARAFAAAGWRGPLNIQCQKDTDGALHIHEFNGRFTGATVDRWMLGFDEVGAAIERFTGRPLASRAAPPAAALEVFESMTTRGADAARASELLRDRVWRRTR
jgi:carbamoyl-phosphate synthase large subunit